MKKSTKFLQIFYKTQSAKVLQKTKRTQCVTLKIDNRLLREHNLLYTQLLQATSHCTQKMYLKKAIPSLQLITKVTKCAVSWMQMCRIVEYYFTNSTDLPPWDCTLSFKVIRHITLKATPFCNHGTPPLITHKQLIYSYQQRYKGCYTQMPTDCQF